MTEIWLITRRTSTLFLIFTSVIFTSPMESSGFQLVTSEMKYEEAKSYCKAMDTDLTQVYNLTEVNAMISLVLPTADRIWIGLELGELWIWHWTGSDQRTSYLNWKTGETQDSEQEACAAMNQNGMWFENDCGTQESFVCQGSGDASSHIFVEVKKSWRDARSHCWDLSSDLVTIQSLEENKAIRKLSTSEILWIGLFKDPWTWLGGSNSSFRFWDANEPNYGNNRGCVTANLKNDGKWSNQNCNIKLSFTCGAAINQVTTSSQTTHQSITTDRPSTNLTTAPHNLSQAGATTFNSTLVTTEQLINNATTVEPSTIPEWTASYTTGFVSHNISNLLNSTKMPMTTTTLPPQTVTTPVLSTNSGLTASHTTEVVSHPISYESNYTSTKIPTMAPIQPPKNVTIPAPSIVTGPTTSTTTEFASHPITNELDNTNTEMATMTPTRLQQNDTTLGPTTGTRTTKSTITEVVSHPMITELTSTNTEMPTITTAMPQNVTNSTPTSATGPTTFNTTAVGSSPITTALNNTGTEMPTMTTMPPSQNVTAPASLTATGPTTFNTTEVVSHPTVPELNSTEMTPTQPPQNTIVNATANNVLPSTAQVGTSAQTATQSPIPISTVSSFSSEDNLILIQKNMTWIAALSFCREHYVDLVQITNKDIQDKVAKRVTTSTSLHVWLGLRYTCNFKFWFWTSSTVGCYQNWQPGEGLGRANECGESGAIQATGRQQWVGLPETQELNFICQTCGG